MLPLVGALPVAAKLPKPPKPPTLDPLIVTSSFIGLELYTRLYPAGRLMTDEMLADVEPFEAFVRDRAKTGRRIA